MSGSALQRVQQCLERQARHCGLNAFVTRANATQLQDAARAIAGRESGGMNSVYHIQKRH